MKYAKLFEKGKIGKLTIKNRIVMTPMGTGFAAASGEASEEIIRFYEERAKGGVGLIISEVCRIDELSGIATPTQLCATDLNVIPSFTRMVDRVHAYDTKMFMQLHHPGNEAYPMTLHGNPVIAPSPVVCKVVGAMPKEMTTAEVEEMVKKYVKGAYIAKAAGFDGEKIIPPVAGIEKACTYEQVLKKEVNFSGKKVAVIGGGLTGLETAAYLSDLGNEVTVIEMAAAVGTAMYRSVTASVVEHITKNGGHIMTNTMFKAVGDDYVTINEIMTGYDKNLPFDGCVIAMGVKPNFALVEEFEAAFDKVAAAGDVVNPGNIADATHSGFDKGFVF